jgi:crotonobetainyl-CoA:carnitine CoA-transferase CaiB-like acyl-CoA transferase
MQPFAGLKVLDFTSLLPGPMATLYLADWGAEVVRVESPDREDMSRTMPPFAKGTSTTHAFLNRSKQSICVDLKDPRQLELLKAEISDYDILIEQFRPGVMQRFGLDYMTLQSLHPRLIYCSLTGYGQTGPYASRAGHDINYAALSGLAAMTGTRKEGPILHGDPVCDLAGTYHALFGILTALFHREKTGEGQFIDISITDCSLMLSSLWMQMQLAAGLSPKWQQTPLNGGTFYNYYQTQDRQYLSVGGLEPKFFLGFLEAIGKLELAKLDLQKPDNQAILSREIQTVLGTKTLAEWQDLFAPLDVCVEPVLSFQDIEQHPHFQARGMFVEVPCEDGSYQKQLSNPLKFSSFRPIYHHIGKAKSRFVDPS